jgi:hypothetical protein
LAEIDGLLQGRPLEPTPESEIGKALGVAASKDPEMLRALLDLAGVLALPEEVFARPGVVERVIELGSDWRDEQLPGPSPDEIVALVA